MTTYTNEFYKDRDRSTRYAAETILGLVLKQIPPIKSAIDIGCGVGTWLSVLQDTYGVKSVTGCDGDWVNQDMLQIRRDDFFRMNLATQGMPATRMHFDLAICLEVAEHLPEERAGALVKYLTAASDTVLFSAAIPGQGGTGHVNEQWPQYWSDLFWKYGYETKDTIRMQIWNQNEIPFWYRQNTLLFSKGPDGWRIPPSLVHPELYLAHAKPGVKGSVNKLREAVSQYVGKS